MARQAFVAFVMHRSKNDHGLRQGS